MSSINFLIVRGKNGMSFFSPLQTATLCNSIWYHYNIHL